MTTPPPTFSLFMNITHPSIFSKKNKQSHSAGVQIQIEHSGKYFSPRPQKAI
jgi:hypothetical protein